MSRHIRYNTVAHIVFSTNYMVSEVHDLEACNLQLFSLEQSCGFQDTNFMPKYG